MMTIPRGHEQESSFSIRKLVTSKSDCLALAQHDQIVYLERGLILHAERDQHRTIRNWHLLFVPPGRGVELRVAAMSRIWQISFDDIWWEPPRLLDGRRIQVFPLGEELAARLEITLSQMLEECTDRCPGYERMIRLKLAELGLLLDRSLPRICPTEVSGGTASLDEIVGYIQSNYGEVFSLSLLAGRCGLTPSYFSRVFKERTGTPVFEYINRIRIQKARGLLKRTEMSIIDIAFAVGYNNVSFFNRYFRKLNGMSPREYRRTIRM